jgi:hypothetical protein
MDYEKDFDRADAMDIVVSLRKTSKVYQLQKTPIRRDNLYLYRGKSKIFLVNAANVIPILLDGQALEEMDNFTYQQGGTEADVRSRVDKARTFHQLKNILGSTNLILNTTIRIFNTTVKPVLLYGAETWRITITTTKKYKPSITPI